ncbi:hypothetical protein DFH09DRAFT_1096039 [Mycena vulgaris]|nr:hypothetical protein DFH09DRAFT_1096039 [Mycena vulgaris]
MVDGTGTAPVRRDGHGTRSTGAVEPSPRQRAAALLAPPPAVRTSVPPALAPPTASVSPPRPRSAASPAASPRVRILGASPRAHRSPPLRHLLPPRAAHASLTASREYEDLAPPRACCPHRPRRAPPRTCAPTRAQGAAAAPSSSYLHSERRTRMPHLGRLALALAPPAAAALSTARGAGLVPDSPPAHWDASRRMSARPRAGTDDHIRNGAGEHDVLASGVHVGVATGEYGARRDHDSLGRYFIKGKGGKGKGRKGGEGRQGEHTQNARDAIIVQRNHPLQARELVALQPRASERRECLCGCLERVQGVELTDGDDNDNDNEWVFMLAVCR